MSVFDWFRKEPRRPRPAPPSDPPAGGSPQVTLRWLLGLSGDLLDGSNESLRFRENIESPNIRLRELRDWCQEALAVPGDPQRERALQDLVNSLGVRLGFQVQYGVYEQSHAGWMPFDGLWRVDESLYLAIEVFAARLEGIDLARLDRDLSALVRNPVVAGTRPVACFVLCQGADPAIEDLIRRSSLHDRIRILPLGTLFDLLRMDQEKVLDRAQLPVLLRPFSPTGVHNLLAFLEQFLTAEPSQRHGFEGTRDPEKFQPAAPAASLDVSLESIKALYQEGQRRAARERLKTYLSVHPDDPAGWEVAGDWAREQGDLESAIRAYRATLSRDSGCEGAVRSLSALYRERGEYRSALEILDQAGGLSVSATLLEERALLLLTMGEAAMAEEAAGAAQARGGGAGALRLLGRAREATGDREGAVSAYRRALDLEPEDRETASRLDQLSVPTGEALSKTGT